MTEKQWSELKDGDVVYNELDGYMTVVYSDAFGQGKELCFKDETSLWRGCMFYSFDWELVKEEK